MGTLWIASLCCWTIARSNYIFQTALWAYGKYGDQHVEAHMPVGWDFTQNFAEAFKDGMDFATGRKVDENWWADVLDAAGTDPFLLGAPPSADSLRTKR